MARHSGTSVIVRPVIDLAGSQPVDSYGIRDRIRFRASQRDRHCGLVSRRSQSDLLDRRGVPPASREQTATNDGVRLA